MWNDPLALNRLTATLLVAGMLVVGYGAVRWFAQRPVFAIRTLIVHTREGGAPLHVTSERIARMCVPQINGTLFTADLGRARAAIEALPWVRSVSLRRQWPDRLVVQIEEHQALARWNEEGGNRFVSVRGEAFDAPGESALGALLPLLTGPEGTERDVARQYEAFRDKLAYIGKQPKAVTLSTRQAWSIRLADGMVLEVGREQPSSTALSRVERFATYYGATMERIAARVDVVDLRYPNGFAVRIPGLAATTLPVRPKAVAGPQRKARAPVRPRR